MIVYFIGTTQPLREDTVPALQEALVLHNRLETHAGSVVTMLGPVPDNDEQVRIWLAKSKIDMAGEVLILNELAGSYVPPQALGEFAWCEWQYAVATRTPVRWLSDPAMQSTTHGDACPVANETRVRNAIGQLSRRSMWAIRDSDPG